MVQFNLLPDVKLEYIHAQRTRRLVLSVSFIVSAVAVTILVFMLIASGVQKKHLNDLSADITKESKTLRDKPNINTILTVQNQLDSLTGLHSAKPAAERLAGFLNALTPATVSISSLNVDFVAHTMVISGNSDALSSVNQFVDTLKLTTYPVTGADGKVEQKPAFTSVVLSSFGLNSKSKDKTQAANYSVTATYDPDIFVITKDVSLNVPTIVTHAQDLFVAGGTQ